MSAFDEVVREATFTADFVAMRRYRTEADKTAAIVRRALEMLVGNGMITINDPATWPEWRTLDPPYAVTP